MPPLLPLLIPGERATRIIEHEVDKMLERMEEMAELVYPDGILPGMKKLPARQRLARYLMLIDPRDGPLIRDVDYLKKRKQGLMPNPVSPFLLNALQPEDDFREIATDMRELMRDQDVPGW